jgi:hypothetical protein
LTPVRFFGIFTSPLRLVAEEPGAIFHSQAAFHSQNQRRNRDGEKESKEGWQEAQA